MINQKYLIDFENLQVGDELFHLWRGTVNVVRLTARHIHTSNGGIYTTEGKVNNNHLSPLIFKSNPFEEELPEFPKLMTVWNLNVNNKFPRYIIAKHPNGFVAIDGAYNPGEPLTHNRITFWSNAEDIPEEPVIPEVPKTVLNKADIARLAGCNVEDLEILD